MRARVEQLLDSQKLHFAHVGLKTTEPGTTKFKLAAVRAVVGESWREARASAHSPRTTLQINALLEHYPSLKRVEMWEDREEHQKKFAEALQQLQTAGRIGEEQGRSVKSVGVGARGCVRKRSMISAADAICFSSRHASALTHHAQQADRCTTFPKRRVTRRLSLSASSLSF